MTPIKKNTVIYFTCVDLGPVTNGGALCCQNHVRRLAADPAIDLHVVVTGFQAAQQANREFVQALGVPFYFVAFRELAGLDLSDARFDAALNDLFPWERTARIQSHVSSQLARIISSIVVASNLASAIVIDYVPSTLFAMPILEGEIPCLLITLANEDQFFRDVRAHASGADWVGTEIAQQRMKQFEDDVYAKAKKVVSFRPSDIRNFAEHPNKYHVVSPVFPEAGAHWRHVGNRSVFFVGNAGHFPNHIAITWLCRELAPRLYRLDDSITIRIIGANPGDYFDSAGAAAPNVEFLGIADRAAVQREFTHCGLFVAPMTIDYGCEIKLQECVSHATPFLATQAALDGLPPLPCSPAIDRADPDAAATRIKNLLDNPSELVAMSDVIDARVSTERVAQSTVWGKMITDMLAMNVLVSPSD